MKVIPIKLSDEIIKKIDFLIQTKKYPNRSVAIRQLLEKIVKREEFFYKNVDLNKQEIEKIVNQLMQEKEVILDIAPSKTAAEIIAEGRGR